ncbi:complex I assembly factor TIMMDC1, mitochondrial-like [Chanos chanos]|uniref:Complex I assembly factor TIMMDC1, mitochondrial n=1 Tax=Chanos chanos TaxID=29144 RepID=A0A6J2VXT6_CHACN|nr:complex I assembly factor TIMMDC1, mitochondrial-like [Chanos chanos]XP_030636681.1 complex I assembly factor TIMMDC1, mitochondrial-like [Chanos chanos]
MPPQSPPPPSHSCRETSSPSSLRGLHVSPLRGLFGLPLPSMFFPRVYAADGVPPQPHAVPLPENRGKPEFPDTGWERLRDVFDIRERQVYPEELRNILKSGLTAAVAGLLYGGLPAARHARQRYIQVSQAEIYQSRVDAVRSAHNAAIRGFVRYGWRWSWRVAVFVTVFNTVSTGLSVYTDENALSHFAVAGAVTGGLFRLNLGLGGLVAGTLIGAALGVPAGALIIALQKQAGETMRERRRRERRELYELKVAEWNARLQLTDELIGEISIAGPDRDPNADLQRIQELLNQPRNEGVAKDSPGR